MELDHIFICVNRDAPESAVIKEFGLVEGAPNLYHGEGTASRRFFFKNAFIDLLWIDNAKEALADNTKRTNIFGH